MATLDQRTRATRGGPGATDCTRAVLRALRTPPPSLLGEAGALTAGEATVGLQASIAEGPIRTQ